MNEVAVVETREGCQSCAITTPDFVIRAWLEGDEPAELGGTMEAVSFRAGAALHFRDRVSFRFHADRGQLVELVRDRAPAAVVADPRLRLEEDTSIDTLEVTITAAPEPGGDVAGTIDVPFHFAGDWGDLVVVAWGGSLRKILDDPRFAIVRREFPEPTERSHELVRLRGAGAGEDDKPRGNT